MRIALIMNDNSYPGREYIRELLKRGVTFDLINIGLFPEFNGEEDKRCGGLWIPPRMYEFEAKIKKYQFNSLKDERLGELLAQNEYDVGIQGGTGILKRDIIDSFKMGILNFHPGDLPQYRGCSAPEWQLFEGKDVICTCHLVDEGIDSGKIFKKKKLFDKQMKNYHKMRSLVYVEIAKFVGDVIENLTPSFMDECVNQDESEAIYRPYIGEEAIQTLIERMSV